MLVHRNIWVFFLYDSHKTLKSVFFPSESRVVLSKKYFVHLKAWDSLRPAAKPQELAAVLKRKLRKKFLVSGRKVCDFFSPDKAGSHGHELYKIRGP